MDDQSNIVPLPEYVERMIEAICLDQNQPPPGTPARRELASIGEEESLKNLTVIQNSTISRSLDGFIFHLARKSRGCASTPAPARSQEFSPQPRSATPSPVSVTDSPRGTSNPSKRTRVLEFSAEDIMPSTREHQTASPSFDEWNVDVRMPSTHLRALHDLEFRKSFLLLSYIGRHKLEDVASVDEIHGLKEIQSMCTFESRVWNKFGLRFCGGNDRVKYRDWDSGKYYYYHCHVYSNGIIQFKGPFLNKTTTLLQKVVGDENVLIVKFAEEENDSSHFVTGSSASPAFDKVAREGIFVGQKCYRFFVFKDGGKEEKKKNPNSNPVKCYFVNIESLAELYASQPHQSNLIPIHEARCRFMHIHNVSSLSNYMVRFSLILSKTITLDVDLDNVHVEYIDDVLCKSEDKKEVYDNDGKLCIHTDGTGFISEDLALRCPQSCYKGSLLDQNIERYFDAIRLEETSIEFCKSRPFEPPLLIQFRMFYHGQAIKGTVLVNRKLPPETIQIRPSMIKVEADPKRAGFPVVNSFEIVTTSNKPKKTRLSKNLIALLSYGGVPKEFFEDILQNALMDAQGVLSNKRAALKVALDHGEIDDDFTVTRMILSGIPLDEPFLQYRLSIFAKEERKSLKAGKLPITDSFYVMGTADPTGTMNSDEVCVIVDNGQISGRVLVYRNPGCHFGDIHILNATYVKALEHVVGNSKYCIIFPTKGTRSIADEIAGGDFDGDMYFVSRNPLLLEYYRPSEPWTCTFSAPKMDGLKRPTDFSFEDLERELFSLFLTARFLPSKTMGIAADSWLVYMDRMLTLGPSCVQEKESLKRKMLMLIDIYYDALDAPKKGKKVEVPQAYKPEKYPHHMERGEFCSYKSTSVLGIIYDKVSEFKDQDLAGQVWKLSCFDVEVPEACLASWDFRYNNYRYEMQEACSMDESKKDSAAEVNQKYKRLLYDADEFEKSTRSWEEVRAEALAIYHVTYNHAIRQGLPGYCGFAWKIAGSALIKIFVEQQGEKPIYCLPSVLREVF
ncbi:hypothetical protein Ancab_016859 [Ancistrocladus abbreviatus]